MLGSGDPPERRTWESIEEQPWRRSRQGHIACVPTGFDGYVPMSYAATSTTMAWVGAVSSGTVSPLSTRSAM